jgi:hypothetical protein
MPVNDRSLFEPLHTFFKSKFVESFSEGAIDPGDTFFRFESASEFISTADLLEVIGGKEAFSKVKLGELASRLAVVSFIYDGIYQHRRLERLDQVYSDIIVKHSQFAAGESSAELNLFASLKAKALKLIEDNERMASDGSISSYLNSSFTPSGWLLPTTTELWTHHTITPDKYNKHPPGLWTTDTLQAVSSISNSSVGLAEPRADGAPTPASDLSSGLWRIVPAVNDAIDVDADYSHLEAPPSAVHEPLANASHNSMQSDSHSGFMNLEFLEQAKREHLEADKVNLDFEYVVVYIERPWLHLPFLQGNFWSLPGLEAGDLTGGHDIQSAISALPVGFVAVKNLRISANWTEQDKVHAQSASHFGPFALDTDNSLSTVSARGVQVIGWINQMLPPLPPRSSSESISLSDTSATSGAPTVENSMDKRTVEEILRARVERNRSVMSRLRGSYKR